MAGLLRHTATKLFVSPSHAHLGRRLPAAFVAVRCMASSKLFVGGLSFHTDENTLKTAFAAHGEVIEAKIIMDRNTGMSRGFAFVSFNTESEAEIALKGMDGQIVNGRVVRVDYATTKPRDGMGGGFQRRFGDGYSPGGSRFNQDSGPYQGGLSFQDSSRSLQGGYPDTGSQTATGSTDGIGSPYSDTRSRAVPGAGSSESNLGWSEASPAAEDFGPIYPRIVYGPKTLQGGYEYSPGPQVPLNVGPAFANANPGFQKSNPIISSIDFGAAYPKSSPGFSGGPADAKSSPGLSDDIGPAYPKSSPGFSGGLADTKNSLGLSDDIGPAYPKSGPGFSTGRAGLSDEIGPAYPKSSPGFSAGRAGLSDDIGPAYPKSSPGFSAGRAGLSDDIGPAYPKSSPGFSAGRTGLSDNIDLAYPKTSTGFSGGLGDAKSGHGLSENIGSAYPKSNPVFSGGPANVKSTHGLANDIGPPYPNGGLPTSFITPEDIGPPYPKSGPQSGGPQSGLGSSENIGPAYSVSGSGDSGSANSEAGPKYAQGGF